MFFLIQGALLSSQHTREIAFEQRRNIQAQTGEHTAADNAIFIGRHTLIFAFL